MQLRNEVLKILLYYDIWSHPLTAAELFAFLPVNSMTREEFERNLSTSVAGKDVIAHDGHYFVKGKTADVVTRRRKREANARRMWKIARLSTHIIKRCPFVRAVFISGDLSKNVTHRESDIDFFIVTEPERLWIARTLLILFKKTFLLNKKRFFCLNYFATSENLRIIEQSIYHATEAATLKPAFNSSMYFRFLAENGWIRSFFPNFAPHLIQLPKVNDRQSKLQHLLELPFKWFDASRLDEYLMKKHEHVWAQRYSVYDENTRSKIFKCTRHESRAFVGNFEEKILALYRQRLKDFAVTD